MTKGVHSGRYLDVGDDAVAASGCYVLLLRCHTTQSGAGFAFFPFPLPPGSHPDDPPDHETEALFSCPCAQESHLPSTDDQIMSNTHRSRRTQETPQGWYCTPRAPSGLAGPGGLQAGQLLWLASPRPTLSSRRQSPLMGGPGFCLRPHTTEKLLCSSLIWNQVSFRSWPDS